MTNKIKAYQVAPEYQQDPLEDCFPVNIAVFGNRRFNQHTFPAFDTVRNALENNEPPDGHENSAQWAILLEEYALLDNGSDKEFLCKGLSILTGRKWDCTMLHGCCQGDWQYMIYPVDEWSVDALLSFEILYWNMGSEWVVDDTHTYCTSWDCDGIRQEIADAIGEPPKLIVLYGFDGWTQTPKYKEMTK